MYFKVKNIRIPRVKRIHTYLGTSWGLCDQNKSRYFDQMLFVVFSVIIELTKIINLNCYISVAP